MKTFNEYQSKVKYFHLTVVSFFTAKLAEWAFLGENNISPNSYLVTHIMPAAFTLVAMGFAYIVWEKHTALNDARKEIGKLPGGAKYKLFRGKFNRLLKIDLILSPIILIGVGSLYFAVGHISSLVIWMGVGPTTVYALVAYHFKKSYDDGRI